MTRALSVAEAKATLSERIREVENGAQILITRHGRTVAAPVSPEDVEHLRRESKANWGFDVMAEAYVDLVEAGIIDPAKVTRCALENAASIAGMILSTEALVSDVQEHNGVATASAAHGSYE